MCQRISWIDKKKLDVFQAAAVSYEVAVCARNVSGSAGRRLALLCRGCRGGLLGGWSEAMVAAALRVAAAGRAL